MASPQPNTGPPAVLRDELDAGGLQDAQDSVESLVSATVGATLKVNHIRQRKLGHRRETVPAPPEQRPGVVDLLGSV